MFLSAGRRFGSDQSNRQIRVKLATLPRPFTKKGKELKHRGSKELCLICYYIVVTLSDWLIKTRSSSLELAVEQPDEVDPPRSMRPPSFRGDWFRGECSRIERVIRRLVGTLVGSPDFFFARNAP